MGVEQVTGNKIKMCVNQLHVSHYKILFLYLRLVTGRALDECLWTGFKKTVWRTFGLSEIFKKNKKQYYRVQEEKKKL